MAQVVELLWRAITAADFFNIERKREHGPSSGGGQTYISISFSGLTYTELGTFLGIVPPTSVGTTRPGKTLKAVAVVYDPKVSADLTFGPRYQPPQLGDRYCIATQNRQYRNQLRHPAWTAQYGFPEAHDEVSSRWDPRMPDLTYLKVFVVVSDDGSYAAGFFNSGVAPAPLGGVLGMRALFEPYDKRNSAGVVDLRSAGVTLVDLAGQANPDQELAKESPEILEALDATKRASGRRASGQGLRASAPERQAIEKRAVEVATATLKADKWKVEDVGLYRPYDLHCTRKGSEKRVEVKGTTGDGSAVLLTPGEVAHAHDNSNVALMVVSGIVLTNHADGTITGSGGDLRVIDPWTIDDDGELKPTGYGYRLT
jgi:hypothetical protein